MDHKQQMTVGSVKQLKHEATEESLGTTVEAGSSKPMANSLMSN